MKSRFLVSSVTRHTSAKLFEPPAGCECFKFFHPPSLSLSCARVLCVCVPMWGVSLGLAMVSVLMIALIETALARTVSFIASGYLRLW